MIDADPETDSEFDPVDLLIDAFLDRYRKGERPSIQSLAQEHPEHANRLRSLIPAMLAMEKLGDPSDPRSGAGHPGLVGKMPERLGDYLLIRPLGFGGMGTVYEAIQESLGRHVALKTIPSPHPDDANRLERFRREAPASAYRPRLRPRRARGAALLHHAVHRGAQPRLRPPRGRAAQVRPARRS